MNNYIKIILLGLLSISVSFSQDTTATVFDTAYFLNKELEITDDNPIVVAMDEMLLDYFKLNDHFTNDTSELNVLNHEAKDRPKISDSLMKARLDKLDDATPFTFEFNDKTKAFINLYVNRRRKLTSIMLARKEYYFPIFEEHLAKYKIPLELKYLAIVESALKPTAESWAGASGLWQFMYNTGKGYGLEVDSYTDDRKDPYKSTEAACHHLKDLYDIYDNWELALAAYNSGAGNVNKAIRRSGGKKDFWSIYKYLPKETQGYVPAFIAVNYAMNYAAEHNIYPLEPKVRYYEMDTIYVNDRIDFKVAAKYLDVPYDELKYLNPRYIHDVIPNSEDESNCFYLPLNKLGTFLANEDSISHYSREFKKVYETSLFASESTGGKMTYRVRSGDYLGKISSKYGCRVSDIKKWNNLRSNNLRVGQRLTIYSKRKASSNKKKQLASKAKTEKIKGFSYYTIQSGDTLWDIANKFPGVSVEDLKRHNSGLRASKLKLGSKIKIVKKG
jgi:membrane-bound lytic murein transglycosylase D